METQIQLVMDVLLMHKILKIYVEITIRKLSTRLKCVVFAKQVTIQLKEVIKVYV